MRLGELAVAEGYVTEAQMTDALTSPAPVRALSTAS